MICNAVICFGSGSNAGIFFFTRTSKDQFPSDARDLLPPAAFPEFTARADIVRPMLMRRLNPARRDPPRISSRDDSGPRPDKQDQLPDDSMCPRGHRDRRRRTRQCLDSSVATRSVPDAAREMSKDLLCHHPRDDLGPDPLPELNSRVVIVMKFSGSMLRSSFSWR